ncbi:hypothetical protein, partial [Pelomonas sp. KK5]|uniref:hypothetical protein n=1 Tax=Pelomonas sp. KK5 TaxID=1855730 RepID=UPI00117C8B51
MRDALRLWHLEAFDLRAGLAFVTTVGEGAERPCLFISPPGFTPEPVDNLALAWGAARARFDTLLLADGEEALFGSPREAAAFVRRAYVASAAGDGGDAPAGLPPPRP